MNKLILTGVVAGIAASIPVLYQSNPQAFDAMLRSDMAVRDTAPAPVVSAAPPRLATARVEQPALLGRKVRLPAAARGHFPLGFRRQPRGGPSAIGGGVVP